MCKCLHSYIYTISFRISKSSWEGGWEWGGGGHRHTGRVSFKGAEVILPEYFVHCLYKNHVDLPEYYLNFCRKWLFEIF